jgi:hypothetical protein
MTEAFFHPGWSARTSTECAGETATVHGEPWYLPARLVEGDAEYEPDCRRRGRGREITVENQAISNNSSGVTAAPTAAECRLLREKKVAAERDADSPQFWTARHRTDLPLCGRSQ